MSDPGNPFEGFNLEDESDEEEALANADLEITEEMIAEYASASLGAAQVSGQTQGSPLLLGMAGVTTRATLLKLLRVPMGQPVRVQLGVTAQGRDGERFVQAIHALMSRMRRHARKRNITLEPFKLYVEYIAKTADGKWEEVSLMRWDKPRQTQSVFDALLEQAGNRAGLQLGEPQGETTTLLLSFDSETDKLEEE